MYTTERESEAISYLCISHYRTTSSLVLAKLASDLTLVTFYQRLRTAVNPSQLLKFRHKLNLCHILFIEHLWSQEHWLRTNLVENHYFFGMAIMPFLCNGTLLFQGHLPRVLPVTVLKYVSCLILYIRPAICHFILKSVWGMAQLRV